MNRNTRHIRYMLLSLLLAHGACVMTTRSIEDDNLIDNRSNQDIPYLTVDQPPQFPDGDAALMKFIMTNLHYPEKLTENPQGRIVVQFVVNKDGSIGDVIIRNSVDEELGKEIIRIVKSLPKFLPGRQNDHPVTAWYTLSININIKKQD